MPRNTRPLRQTQAYELSDQFRYKKYYYESFKGGQQPHFLKTTAGLPALPTANQGDISIAYTNGGYWEFFETTAQTLFPTGVAGSGLNIACDLVENEALELVPGGNSSASRLAFTLGTSPNFFFRAKYNITDVSGADQAVLAGFRKQEAFAVPVSLLTTGDGVYTDFSGIGLSGEDGVDVKVVSDLNNSGSTVVTDTGFNLTDSQVVEVTAMVIAGKVVYKINGVQLGNPVAKDGDGAAISSQVTLTSPSFTFDSGDVLVPWIFLRHDDEVAEGFHLQEVEIGFLADAGLDPNAL